MAATWPEEVDRLALLYPGLIPQLQPTWWQSLQLNLARHFDIRQKGINIPLTDPALFTDVAEHQQFIAEDPLTLHRVTSGFLNAGRDLDRITQEGYDRINQPTLLMLAGRDQVINNTATGQLAARFGTEWQTIIRYPAAQHTLEFEPDRERFVSDLIAWLEWCGDRRVN